MPNINLQNISLSYPVYGVGAQSIKNNVLNAATGGRVGRVAKIPIVQALKNISVNLVDGDRVGLIGHNGAGKSSLLRLLAGIYTPTSGLMKVEGRILSTINLSVGLEMEATGYENIVSLGLLLGMTKAEIFNRFDDIAASTELGEYLDMPVRIYSTGMLTRLGFAVATSHHADILLMDEVIGTGDAAFVEQAELRLNKFLAKAKILVLASHNDEIIRKLCNKAILLVKGELVSFGAIDEVLGEYRTTY